jgi:hypothetical protein
MILDPCNWDHMPEPLIANTVFKSTITESPALEKKAKETDKTLLPWM